VNLSRGEDNRIGKGENIGKFIKGGKTIELSRGRTIGNLASGIARDLCKEKRGERAVNGKKLI